MPREGSNRMPDPVVSVVMAVYNGEQFLAEAIDSILNQTFHDFEFIIVNDGSTDQTAEILRRYQHRDARVRVLHQENRGLVASLNRGCALAGGKYLARMDADDVSLPERLARQIAFMDTHHEIAVLGSAAQAMDIRGNDLGVHHPPCSQGYLRWRLLFQCPLAHSSTVIRREVFHRVGGYQTSAVHAEDYDLWCRISEVAGIANLPDILLKYRIHNNNISKTQRALQRANSLVISRTMIAMLLGTECDGALVACFSRESRRTARHLLDAAKLLNRLQQVMAADLALLPAERRLIRWDAAQRLLSLIDGGMGLRHGWRVCCWAMSMDPLCLARRGAGYGRWLAHLARQATRAFRRGGLAGMRASTADFLVRRKAART